MERHGARSYYRNGCIITRQVGLLVVLLASTVRLPAIELIGTMTFVNTIPESTPVYLLRVTIRTPTTGATFTATCDKQGKFTLKDVVPGRYRLDLSMPARIRSFEVNSQQVHPSDFEITSETKRMAIVLNLASADVSVKILELPKSGDIVALLAPFDPMLTLQWSCIQNQVSGPDTSFRFLAPGKYRLFIVDAHYAADVARYGPRQPDFLRSDAVIVDAGEGSKAEVTAHYIEAEVVETAVVKAGRLQ